MTALQSADLELIDRDAALPGLRCVLDPRRLAETLGKAAFPVEPGDIRLDYVRYRPQRDCVGRLLIRMDGDQHFAYVKAFGSGSREKFDKAANRAGIDGPHGAGRLAAPDTGLLFSWFPNDRKLRSLERIGRRDTRERLIERVFKGDDAWLGSEMTVINYKPEKRLVCRLSQPGGRSATVKFYTAAEFKRTGHLRRNRTFPADLPVPRYIGGSKKHRVHAFEWLPGRSLREVSLDPAGDVTLYRRAGKLLAELQSLGPGALARPTARSLAEDIHSSAGHLASILPDIGREAADCGLALARFVERAHPGECPVHADFYDKQVIAGPSRLALIDLDQARLGSAAEDPGCFLAHLELLGLYDPGFSATRVSQLGQSLLDGFLDAGGECNEQELAGWTAFSLFGLAHQPFRDRLPDWPGHVRAVLARTQELLRATGSHS
jgi:hypothetical protein